MYLCPASYTTKVRFEKTLIINKSLLLQEKEGPLNFYVHFLSCQSWLCEKKGFA